MTTKRVSRTRNAQPQTEAKNQSTDTTAATRLALVKAGLVGHERIPEYVWSKPHWQRQAEMFDRAAGILSEPDRLRAQEDAEDKRLRIGLLDLGFPASFDYNLDLIALVRAIELLDVGQRGRLRRALAHERARREERRQAVVLAYARRRASDGAHMPTA